MPSTCIPTLQPQTRTRPKEILIFTPKPGISFGTAGLSARVYAGFSSMNPLVVIQTSQGLAEYILKVVPGAAQAGVVIGYDMRDFSMTFAKHAAAAFIAKGIKVYWYEELVHTPMVPFAIRQLGAVAGLMMTGCHCVKGISGMKIYGANGCLINFPDEQGMSIEIEKNLKPLTWKTYEDNTLLKPIMMDMEAKYLQSLKLLVNPHFHGVKQTPKFLYTPLHGVGLHWMMSALKALHPALETKIHVFELQAKPDSDFPTIDCYAGPNPEEFGPLILAQKEADKRGLKIVLANDPDADRFVYSENRNGKWHQISGDQMGCIIAKRLLEIEKHKYGTVSGSVIVQSAVSSELLGVMAKAMGFKVVDTLSGFKWLGNETVALKSEGEKVLFAFEEAIAYMFPDLHHDSDGIAAALMYLTLFNLERNSPWEEIKLIGDKYGHYVTKNSCYRYPDAEMTWDAYQHVQSWYKPQGFKIANRDVIAWVDLQKGFDSRTPDKTPTLPHSSDTWMISCWLSGTATDDGIKWSTRREGNEANLKRTAASDMFICIIANMMIVVYVECHGRSYPAAKAVSEEVAEWLGDVWYHDPREQQRFAKRAGIQHKHSSTI